MGCYFIGVTADGFWAVFARGMNGNIRMVMMSADYDLVQRTHHALAAALN